MSDIVVGLGRICRLHLLKNVSMCFGSQAMSVVKLYIFLRQDLAKYVKVILYGICSSSVNYTPFMLQF